MLKDIIRRLRNESGQAMVEFAVTLPILIMILCGIIDYGWIITNQNSIDHSAREGARYAIVNSVQAGAVESIKTYTKSLAPSGITENLTVDVTFTNPGNPRLGDVIVEVSGDVQVLTPITGVFVQDQVVNLTSLCRMKVE